MSKYSAIKASVNAYIKRNGRKEITGMILNAVLNSVIDSLGRFYQFAGIAKPDTDPGVIDQNIVYLASTPGTYDRLGGVAVEQGEIAVIKYDGQWRKEVVVTLSTKVSQLINDAGYITNAVSDLLNYYTRGEISAILGDYYDKEELDTIVSAITGQSYVVAWDGASEPVVADIPAGVSVIWNGNTYVGTLPASADTTNKIYLVGNGAGYDEYITTGDQTFSWLFLGTTEIDLSGYALNSDLERLDAKVDGVMTGGERLNFSDYTKHNAVINPNDKWDYQTSGKGRCILVSTAGYSHIKVTMAGGNGIVAFLKTDVIGADNSVPDFSVSIPGRVQVLDGNTAEYDVPADGAFLYVQTNGSSDGADITGRYTILMTPTINKIVYKEDFADLVSLVEDLEELLVYEDSVSYGNAVSGYGIIYSNGLSYSSETLARTGYVDISKYRTIRYARGAAESSTTTAGMAFYDANRNYISGQRFLRSQPPGHNYQEAVIDVPADAVFARFSIWDDNQVGFYIYGTYDIDTRMDAIEDEISNDNPFIGKKMVANGDSLVYGTSVADRGDVFTSLMGDELGMSVINYAIGGSVVAKRASDYDEIYFSMADFQSAIEGGVVQTTKKYLVKDNYSDARPYRIYSYDDGDWSPGGSASYEAGRTPLVDRVAEMDSDADVILIGIGTNDWAYMWTPFGDDLSREKTDFCGAMHLLCQHLIETYPTKLILFITPPFAWRYQPSGISKATWNMTTWDARSPAGKTWWDYLDMQRSILKQYGIPMYDIGSELGFSQQNTWWCGDTDGKYVHPGEVAQPYIARLLCERLKLYYKQPL